MTDHGGLPARLAEVQDRIASACTRAGRRPEDVTLVGVTKTHPAALVEAAWRAGLRIVGENRVQEALGKRAELAHLPPPPEGPEWHLIGPLQSNKVRAALDLFRTIHSIDRPKIAEAVDREAAARGLHVDGFLEINVGAEESKHGFLPDGLAGAVRPLARLAGTTGSGLRIAGLMAIPPFADDPEASRPWFVRLRELARELAALPEWAGFPGFLSMGMSHDYEVAIEEGATHVRVGTALFGARG
ncbi:MAG TPA: YggS family pyridoxal phosphate-dependent enzyme [Thermoanaerobaculia bacterium]|nr:YggS family pyridoxal phosphate-dependent enzyme [Thermoanaerobaculia bacterium]